MDVSTIKLSRRAWALLAIDTSALLLIVVAAVTKSDAKETVAIAAAIAGLSMIGVGIIFSVDAFKLLYDKDRDSSVKPKLEAVTEAAPNRSAIEQVTSDLTNAASIAGAGTISVDLNKLLPELIKMAAGLAVALLLLGTLLLGGATFGTPEATASVSPAAATQAPASAPAPSRS
jgi:hypothetical protein